MTTFTQSPPPVMASLPGALALNISQDQMENMNPFDLLELAVAHETAAKEKSKERVVSASAVKESPSSLPKPSSLQELHIALLRLRQALNMPNETTAQKESRQELIKKCVLELKEKIPKGEIDLSQETYYDLFKFLKMSLEVHNLIKDEPQYLEIKDAFNELYKKMVQKYKHLQLVINKNKLDFGTCYGHTIARIEQATPCIDEESERAGRFFHIAMMCRKKYEDDLDPIEIGNYIIANSIKCSFVYKAAHILGYETGKEMDLLEDVRKDRAPIPRLALARLLGNMVISYRREIRITGVEAVNKCELKKQRKAEINEELSKLSGEPQKEEQLKKELESLTKEIEELEKTKASYGPKIKRCNEFIEQAQKTKRAKEEIPERIMKRHGVRKSDKVMERTPFNELPDKIKKLPDKKGKFDLRLKSKAGVIDHSIYLSFDPPCFIDNNDTCYITGKKKVRTFNTLDELLTFLPDYLQFKYSDVLDQAELIRYEKTASISAPSALAGKVAKAAQEAGKG